MVNLTPDEAWMAGLLEGEGNFDCANGITPRIRVTMTDLDVMIRAAEILNAGSVCRMRRLTLKLKQAYYFGVHGAPAVEWMKRIRPIMGERRRAQIDKCLAVWDAKQLWTGRRRQAGKPGPRLSSPMRVWLNPAMAHRVKEACHS